MQGRYSIHAPLLVKTLLQHFISQDKAPPGLYRSSGGGSIVIGLACMSKLKQELCSLCVLARKCTICVCACARAHPHARICIFFLHGSVFMCFYVFLIIGCQLGGGILTQRPIGHTAFTHFGDMPTF
jgi:hypothetical protein